MDNSYLNFTNFSNKNINFVIDLVNKNCKFKSWETLKKNIIQVTKCVLNGVIDSGNPTNLERKNK